VGGSLASKASSACSVSSGSLDRQGRAVGAEDVGQHARGVVAGDFPFAACGGIEALGVFLAIGQADRVAVRVHQQIALGQEAREEHAVPVFVGDLGDEVVDGLRVVGAQQIAECAAMGTQADAQLFLRLGGVGRSVFGGDGEGLQRLGGTGFGCGSRLGDRGFEDTAVFAGEGLGHSGSKSEWISAMDFSPRPACLAKSGH
jgi:hypothetical protein